MRVLLTGDSRRWMESAGIERALRRAGHETLLLDDRRIKRRIGRALTQRWALRERRRFRPDWVLLDKCHALELETVEALVRDVPSTMWYHDPVWVRHPERPQIAHIIQVARLSRHFFVTGFDAEWRALGMPAIFLPAAGDGGLFPVPYDPRFASRVAFIGTGYAADRAAFLERVGRHAELTVWGSGWEPWRRTLRWSGRKVEGRDFAAVCSSSGVNLGIDPEIAAHATNWASNRMWLTILAGGFYLGERTPGVDRLLHDGVHCAFYDDEAACIERIGYYLGRPAERERIRTTGEAFVRAHHTFDQRIGNLLSGAAFVNPL